MSFNWKKVLTAIAIGSAILYVALSVAYSGQIPSIKEYKCMIKYLEETGSRMNTKGGNLCVFRVFNAAPEGAINIQRIVEFIYCYPPCPGVNITLTTYVKHKDGSSITAFYMDDADMDRKPNSIVRITFKFDKQGNKTFEEAVSVDKNHPMWEKWLSFIYEKFKEEAQWNKPSC